MASSSTLDPDNYPASTRRRSRGQPHDSPAFGPSDSTDSGSDVADSTIDEDVSDAETDSDRYGTGERLGARKESNVRAGSDIETDRIVGEEEAGLGGGLDQAEEAQLGVTDEALAQPDRAQDPFRKLKRRLRDLSGRRAEDGKK